MSAEIIAARDAWLEWANREQMHAAKGWATHASARTGFDVVESLNRELETGIPHCAHCQQPTENCKAQ